MTGHKERLLKYLQQNGKKTTIEAIEKLRNTRLSEYIRQLRKDEYIINNIHKTGINVFGEKCHYDEFVLKEEER